MKKCDIKKLQEDINYIKNPNKMSKTFTIIISLTSPKMVSNKVLWNITNQVLLHYIYIYIYAGKVKSSWPSLREARDRWVGIRTGAGVTPYKYDKAFLVPAHGSMGIGDSIQAR